MGVSLNGGTPKTPQNDHFVLGKSMVVGYHHFRKPPYNPTSILEPGLIYTGRSPTGTCRLFFTIHFLFYPIPSMYGIFTYIYHKGQLNVGKHAILWVCIFRYFYIHISKFSTSAETFVRSQNIPKLPSKLIQSGLQCRLRPLLHTAASLQLSYDKKKKRGPLLSRKYWLFNRDPYNGLWTNPHITA